MYAVFSRMREEVIMSSKDQEQAAGTMAGNTIAPGTATTGFSVLSEQEQQLRDDYEWCLCDPEVRRLHGGEVVAAHQRRIWGAGRSHTAALQAALQEPACPSRNLLALVVVPEEISPGAVQSEE
jgi:hypothetical protein